MLCMQACSASGRDPQWLSARRQVHRWRRALWDASYQTTGVGRTYRYRRKRFGGKGGELAQLQ